MKISDHYLSDCCDAPVLGELEVPWLDGWTHIIKSTPLGNYKPKSNLERPKQAGKCSKCKENSLFYKEEEIQ